MEGVLNLVKEVSEEGKPKLTEIGLINIKDSTRHPIVSLWAGVGEVNPIARARHLKAQNEEMKNLLKISSVIISSSDAKDISKDLLLNIQIVLDTFE